MMDWKIEYLSEVKKDFDSLAGNQKKLVMKAILKVSKNPLPQNKGGYGKPLGNKLNNNLTGFLKIKIKNAGIRIVYKAIESDGKMLIIVICIRADAEVYKIAQTRVKKHNL